MLKKIVVVIPSYNNVCWYERNLASVISQDYPKFRVIYTDDLSTDKTGELVEKYLNKHKQKDKFKLICNKERKGAMRNLYDMIHSCDDEEIIVTLDGDDWFAHSGTLRKVNKAYQDDNVWMTYGSYIDSSNGHRGCAKPVPQHVIDKNAFRRHQWCFSHLRTFKAGIFKKLPESDFKINDKWMASAWDLPIMFGIAELSGNRIRHIHDILYVYNNGNPISDYKVRLQEQQTFERIVRGRKPHSRL